MVSAEHSQIAPNREKVDKPTSQRRAMPVVSQLYVLEEAPDSSDETGEVCGVLQLALPNFALRRLSKAFSKLLCQRTVDRRDL